MGIFVVIVVKGEGWNMCKLPTFVGVVMMLFEQRCGELFLYLSDTCEDCRLCDECIF